MDFNYQKDGDILYGVETFRFRYQGQQVANIQLYHFLDDNQYAYDVNMTNDNVPSQFKVLSSADSELFKSLELEFKFVYNDKQEALQHAIDIISAVMIKISH